MFPGFYPAGIWAVDFEFTALPGERQQPICMVARELRSGRVIRIWEDQFGPTPPFPIGADALFVAFNAAAELGCFRVLGWPMPARILDLSAEIRDRTSGRKPPTGSSLLGAQAYFGLDVGSGAAKREMQEALGTGTWRGKYTPAEVLDYCDSDTLALARLLPAMAPQIALRYALFRGRYMAAVAAMEFVGPPIDVNTLELLRRHWGDIKGLLIADMDKDYGVFDGLTFKRERWRQYLIRNDIPWPLLESGELDLSDETFRQMSRAYPAVSPMRELRHALSDLRLEELAVGKDGFNRCPLWAFGSKTGRNQPSNTRSIFGPSVFLRSLIRPKPGYGIAYLDWGQQEFGIAAALSGDQAMLAAYLSGDPYLAFAILAGAVPPDATKETHSSQRELFKQCILATQYGMEARSLAMRIAQPKIVADDLLRAHRETFRDFWAWSDACVDQAILAGSLQTVLGWHVYIDEGFNPRSLRNFPMQANGAEMMRIAACLATERGIAVCAPIHDAFLITAPLERLEEDAARMRAAVAEASRIVLKGFELRVDVSFTRFPDRYTDKRGRVMWERVMRLVAQAQQQAAARDVA